VRLEQIAPQHALPARLFAFRDPGQIENPDMEMSLRLSSHLLAGLSRIYTRKVQFLFTDCNEALSKITLVWQSITLYSQSNFTFVRVSISNAIVAGFPAK
jgi:hypothetical protein